jgi:hypothetical protein
MMSAASDDRVEALELAYTRLRRAAQGVLDAANYPAGADQEPRIYRSQLATLDRELRGTPQPTSRLAWMSPT